MARSCEPKNTRRKKRDGKAGAQGAASNASAAAGFAELEPAEPAETVAGSRAILTELLKREGESDVATLAERLGITGVAVRQHLAAMERDGQLAHRSVRRPVGRPARLYRLTDAAEPLFPQSSDRVALDLLVRVERLMGPDAMRRLFETRLDDLTEQYRKRLRGVRSWNKKLEVLAGIRDSEGYLCDVEAVPASEVKGGARLVEHHCPVSRIAKQHPQMCGYELELFRRVLDEPELRRSDHIRSGGQACAYEVPRKPSGPAPRR